MKSQIALGPSAVWKTWLEQQTGEVASRKRLGEERRRVMVVRRNWWIEGRQLDLLEGRLEVAHPNPPRQDPPGLPGLPVNWRWEARSQE